MINLFKKNNEGQALVELALVLPILLLLVFGIIEFGRVFGTYLMVTHSAREGARAAAVGALDEEIKALVEERTSALHLNKDKVNIHITPGEIYRSRGDGISIQVEYPLKIHLPIISIFIGDSYNVKSHITMRME
ncbi:pilus assembly protein [Serpentinicella sp. ANB-PHB4]|uniref:TadE/TadG family type IV pilus assembly protein n=1 Tax=Serpentinicella sp. ANB-PHB4 TaxID=3074076 RepID=UPI00285CC5C1|nr:pilus assembly protein [Serpentinicella sp. ANB-PHB4]MDR5658932.1 pilus assembly protein [Serpentinicella sp. ANB-PHB4]